MSQKYTAKISQNATHLRVFEGDRILQGQEVIDVIHSQSDRIAELEEELELYTNDDAAERYDAHYGDE